jgi:hypothetical protein
MQTETTEALYPPGIKLYGPEKEERDRKLAEAAAAYVDPGTGRIPPAKTGEVYERLSRMFGLTRWGVIAKVPSELKPTNLETLEYARSLKGKKGEPEEGATAGMGEAPEPGASKKRDPGIADRIREAAKPYLNPETGRIPAEKATEVYERLSAQFQRTKGTVANYLKGLGPTAQECAAFRWSAHPEQRKEQGGLRKKSTRGPQATPVPQSGTRVTDSDAGAAVDQAVGTVMRDALGFTEPEPDYANHPAALFPKGELPETKRQRQVRRRTPTTARDLVDRDGRLTDYDEKPAEAAEKKLDPATEEFLNSFKVQQAAEFIDALRDCGRAMRGWVGSARQELGAVTEQLTQARSEFGSWLQENGLVSQKEHQELREYVQALEEENAELRRFKEQTVAFMRQALGQEA